ncbi:MAG: aminoacyl-tRNA hydrolase, partial [Alphaproteobacteria bacterium]|nr:aminoacyl-tRNA hydrolase [Alphaproteobacteria bacterium]
RRHGFGPFRARHQGLLADGVIGGERILALKPQTYMNESGRSVREAAHFHKVGVEGVIVLHDELDLAPGKVRVKVGGGSAGHNGLRSIDAHLGNGFKRVRLGIGHPGDRSLVTHYVLQDFAKAEAEWLSPLIEAVADAFPLLTKGDDAGFMSRVALLSTTAR